MTPVEIGWALEAFAARERRAMERADALAWLVGRYVAVGLNAPRRYPRKPDGVKQKVREMSPEEMKKVLAGLGR